MIVFRSNKHNTEGLTTNGTEACPRILHPSSSLKHWCCLLQN